MKAFHLLSFLIIALCGAGILSACSQRQADAQSLLSQAESLMPMDADSVAVLLAQMEHPERLPREALLRYGWLKAYIHYEQNVSMSEDSLVLPAADWLMTQGDTLRQRWSYLLKSAYLHWLGRDEESMDVLDEGVAAALAQHDSTWACEYLGVKGQRYVYVRKDYPRAADAYRRALALHETAGGHSMLAVALGLMRDDSAAWHFNRSVDLAFLHGDTAQATYYLRNYAQLLTSLDIDLPAGIAVGHRLLRYSLTERERSLAYAVISEGHLKLGQLDSAQHYLDLCRRWMDRQRDMVSGTNLTAYLQGVIDYTRTGSFNFVDVMRYNDSVSNALYAVRSTASQKAATSDQLTQANLTLLIERQRMQLSILVALLVFLLVGGGLAVYVRRRRRRLIEAEERIGTLNRLLAEAAPNNDDADSHLFRRVLLQQLGLIRLVAGQPTAQNQELLRRFSTLAHPQEETAEGLLVWKDLYPVIDRVYDQFYTRLHRRYGTLLTDKEQQLCCLLRADFSTKEISVITRQSIPTIYQRKTTIRKKLGMDEKGDIVEFLSHPITTP